MIENTIKEAERIYGTNLQQHRDQNIVFGGKKNLLRRQRNLISKEEWRNIRTGYLYVIGEAGKHGNRKFRIQEDLKSILFQPASSKRKADNINLLLPNLKKSTKKILKKLHSLQT